MLLDFVFLLIFDELISECEIDLCYSIRNNEQFIATHQFSSVYDLDGIAIKNVQIGSKREREIERIKELILKHG